MAVVGLATWQDLPELSEDDRLLVESLGLVGVTAEPVVWNAPSVRWDRFNMIVLRSTWDYHHRIDEFLHWIDLVAARTELRNASGLVRWNSHKGYLRDLERRGIPIILTVWGSDVDSAVGAARDRHWDRWVLKPAVSAAGHGVSVFTGSQADDGDARFHELRARGEVLIQPYLEEVERVGERSLVYLDGQYSHAVSRAPKLSPDPKLREGDVIEPTVEEISAATRVLRTVPEPTLYARVDLVPDRAGPPRLMELELIEPALFLGSRPGASDRLARAIRDQLSAPRR